MKKIFFLLTTTLLMVACQESNFDVVAPEGLTPGDVYASLDVSTKTSLGEGNVVNWVTNDSISVFAANTYNYRYKLKDGNGTISGKFEYDGYTGTGSDIANHYAVYPYSKDNNVDADGKLTVTFPSEFNAENGVAKAVMVSKSPTANNFAFKNVQGLIRLRLTAAENLPPTFNKVKKVQVTSATKKLAGAATVTFDNDGTPTVALPALEQNKPDTLTIDFGEGITLSSTDKDVYFPLAAGDYTDIELIFTMDGNKISKFSSISFTQAISKIYTLSHKFVMDDVDASTQGYETVAPTAEKAAELLETENSVEVSKMEANETLTIPEVKAGEEVNIKIDQVEGDGPVKIQASNDENKAPKTLTVEAPANAKVIVDCPATHVELIGTDVTYDEVTASTSDNTLVVGEGVTVTSLVVKKGNVEVQGTVTTVTRDGENQDATTKVFLNGGSLTNTPASPIEVLNKDFKIGDVFYYTLADAIAEVESGQTITVVNNVTNAHGISVPSGKNFTVDFKNHKYAMQCPGAGSEGTKTIGFQLLEGSTIVFTNGTIECTEANKNATWTSDSKSKGIAMMIQNYANLTLENMTIDATNIAHNGAAVRYALSNNCGTVKYTGTTSITTLSGDYAFDVCKYANYNAPTVTWNSEGTVTGGIELSGGEFVLEHNLEVKQPIKVIAPATLALGDCTLSASDDFTRPTAGVIIVNRKGDLTVKGNENGTIQANDVYAAVLMTEKDVDTGDTTNPAKLTVESGTLIGQNYGITGNGSTGRGNTEITIKGGTVKGTKTDDCVGIYHPQSGTLAINGGTIEGAVGIYVKAGTVTTSVKGGTIKGIGEKDNYSPCTNGFHSTGDAIVFDNCGYPGGEPNATINGGSFISTNGSAVASYATGSYNPISPVINGGTFSDLSGVNYVADNDTYTLAATVTLATPLEIKSGKTFTIDLGNNTLNGRTNITHGNVTFKNGTIKGGIQQALNVYGSSESSVTKYSVVTIDSDVTVEAEVFGVCLFGPKNTSTVGYGAGIDIKGTVTTTKTSSSKEGAIFVSGNLGSGQDSTLQAAMEGKNFVNISGTVTSKSDAALALNGSATATITGNLTGNTGIAAKRGKLIVKDNATITGNGDCVNAPSSNNSGTELTGSAVSASSTYGERLSIDLQGGTYTSKAYTILNNAKDATCTFNISGGTFDTKMDTDGIVVYARLGSVNITGGSFTNKSNTEATLHVGCPSAGLSNGPKLTISGTKTVVKNEATGNYSRVTSLNWSPLTVNMANELTYKAVEISGGTFHGQSPEKDDSWKSENDNTTKVFLKGGYKATESGTNVWTVTAESQQ